MERTGDDHVLLDVSHMSEEFFSNRCPTIFAKGREEGINIPTQPIPIHPAQHYFMGGIKTDLNGMTSIDGLYAAGECACTGIHGANRLASNSMLECLVFGRRVARHIAASRRAGREKLTFSGASSASGTVLPRAEISARHELLRKIMSRHVGAVKTQKGLEIARTEIGRMREMLEASCMNNIDEFELLNMVTVAEEIVLSSLSRKTSIGAHYLAEEK
jgi:L-aspartate oxidase